jgi:uncharacterized membrane protein
MGRGYSVTFKDALNLKKIVIYRIDNIFYTNNINMGKRFVLYGCVGWCVEVFWTGLGSLFQGDIMLKSRTYIWMLPIYGLAIFIEPVHDRMRHWPIIVRGGVYGILILLIEFSTGMFLKLLLGACPWDYSGNPFSVYGVIRLDYFVVWSFAGLLFERIHNELDKIAYSTMRKK